MGYTRFDRAIAWLRFRAALPHIRPGTRVCDIGCGLDARFLGSVGSRAEFGVGLDYQVSAGPPGLAIIRADITRGLPLKSSQFDHALMLAVLEHLTEPGAVLREAFRVLVPDGSLILTWPQPEVDRILHWFRGWGIIAAEMESEKHQPRAPLSALQKMLGEIGFERFFYRRFELGLNNLLVCYKGRRECRAETRGCVVPKSIA